MTVSQRMLFSLSRFLLPTLALASGLSVNSCRALPPAWRAGEANLKVPGTWANAAGPARSVDYRWLARFRDPALSRLVEEALQQNPDMTIAAARLQQAQAQAVIAGAAGRPQINFGFDASRNRSGFRTGQSGGSSSGTGTGQTGGGTGSTGSGSGGIGTGTIGATSTGASDVITTFSNNFGARLNLSWELDLWGRIRANVSAAIGAAQAAEGDYQAARSSLAAQVARAYFALLEAEEQERLAQDSVAIFENTERTIRERFTSGLQEQTGSAAQVRLALSDVANAIASLEQTRGQKLSARRQLELLAGRYPTGTQAGNRRLPDPGAVPPVGLPSDLLMRRPDIVAAERRFAAQGMRIKEAYRAVFPQISLTTSGGLAARQLKDLLNSSFGTWNLAGNLLQPIFTGGQIKGNISLRRGEETQALGSLQSTVLQAFGEVEAALTNEDVLRRREIATAQAARLADEADAQARADYATGVGDILTILTAQRQRIVIRSQLLTLQRLRLDNRVQLHLALGGDYQSQPK